MKWIDELIAEGKAILYTGDMDEMKGYVKRVVTAIRSDFPAATNGLNCYKSFMAFNGKVSNPLTKKQLVQDVQTLIVLLGRLNEEKAPAHTATDKLAPSININASPVTNINAATSSNAVASSDASIASTISAVMALPPDAASEEDKIEVVEALAELEKCERGSDSFKDKAMGVLKVIGAKSFELAKVVLPALVGLMA